MKHLLTVDDCKLIFVRMQRVMFLLWNFLFYLPLKDQGRKDIVFIEIGSPHLYHRYFYLFVKLLSLGGLKIHMSSKRDIFKFKSIDPYLYLLIKERIIHFKKPDKTGIGLVIDDHVLSPDYFSFLEINNVKSQVFYVPMAQHPLMYHQKLWDNSVENYKRKHSVFTVGKFNQTAYNALENIPKLNVLSRNQLYNHLTAEELTTTFRSEEEFVNFINSQEDHKCILLNSADFDIPMQQLRQTLSRFSFFLACPGVTMPFAHNIVEAMSVGCIPIIQKEYSEMFFPPLKDDFNAIVFVDLEDLSTKIKTTIQYSNKKTLFLRKNALDYYHAHLTPSSVVEKLSKKKFDKIYLQAEHRSIEMIKSEF